MKKKCFLLVLFLLIFISGCKKESKEELFKICNIKSKSNENAYRIQSEYKIYGKDKLVTKIEKEEIVISEDEEMLKYFEEYLGVSYSNLNEKYGGYDNKITKDNDKIISNTTINFDSINIKDYIKDNESMKNYVDKDYNLTEEQIVSFYEEKLDAKCK